MSVFSGVETAIPEYALAKNQEESQANVDLFHAAEKGNLKSAKAAVASGGTPHFFYHPEDQKNSLHVASQGGHLEVVKYLLSVGAGLDVETGMDQSSSLVLAAQEGHLDIIRFLAPLTENPNAPNGNLASEFGVDANAPGMDFLKKDYRSAMKKVEKVNTQKGKV